MNYTKTLKREPLRLVTVYDEGFYRNGREHWNGRYAEFEGDDGRRYFWYTTSQRHLERGSFYRVSGKAEFRYTTNYLKHGETVYRDTLALHNPRLTPLEE